MTDIVAGYGCDRLGRLTRVMLHRPGPELDQLTHANCRRWLFDRPPDPGLFADEHDRYRELLESHGVEVLELTDFVAREAERARRLPNLTYLHDTAAITSKGALLSAMTRPARRGEENVVREALTALDVPILNEFDDEEDHFEGCLVLSPDTLLVAETERHNSAAVAKFIPRALQWFTEVIRVEVPKARRFMHPDTIYNRITDRLALAYLPGFRASYLHTDGQVLPIDFREHMRGRGVELICVSDSEQRRLACSFVPLEPGVIVHYDTALDRQTQRRLARRGVELILFHPQAMTAGGGSLRCLTLRMRREPPSGGE
jgi:arginine deiminase